MASHDDAQCLTVTRIQRTTRELHGKHIETTPRRCILHGNHKKVLQWEWILALGLQSIDGLMGGKWTSLVSLVRWTDTLWRSGYVHIWSRLRVSLMFMKHIKSQKHLICIALGYLIDSSRLYHLGLFPLQRTPHNALVIAALFVSPAPETDGQ
jgi:hypothetical protein